MNTTEKNITIDVSQGTLEFPEKSLSSDDIPMPEFKKMRKSKPLEIYADAELWKIIDDAAAEIRAFYNDLTSDKVEPNTHDTDNDCDDIEDDEDDNIECEQSSDDWSDDFDYDPFN